MSHMHEAANGDSGDARVIQEHHIADPDGEDGAERTDEHRRRWYHLLPEPRRRTDLLGFNSTWWMAVAWVILILVVASPFPWWW